MDPRRQRTIEALLRAGQEIFVDRPFEEVTVEEIAAAAGVSIGSLYNHFGSKAGLYASVVEKALEVDAEIADAAYADEDAPPLVKLLAAAGQYLKLGLEHPQYFRMLASSLEPGQYPAGQELAERLAANLEFQNRRTAETLQKAMDDGTFRQLDAEKLALGIWASWFGIISLQFRNDNLRVGPEGLQDMLILATDVVLNGLLPRD